MTLKELAEHFGICRERVRQDEAIGLRAIRKELKKTIPQAWYIKLALDGMLNGTSV